MGEPDRDRQLLALLLAQPLPRAERCGTCYAFDPAEDGSGFGDCLKLTLFRYIHINDRCDLWEPKEAPCSTD